jgi:hypothetical protein
MVHESSCSRQNQTGLCMFGCDFMQLGYQQFGPSEFQTDWSNLLHCVGMCAGQSWSWSRDVLGLHQYRVWHLSTPHNHNTKYSLVHTGLECEECLQQFANTCNWTNDSLLLHCVVVKSFDISEEHNCLHPRVTEVVHIDIYVIQVKNCFGYIGWFEGVWPIRFVEGGKRGLNCSKALGVEISKDGPSLHGIYGNNVECECGLISACS